MPFYLFKCSILEFVCHYIWKDMRYTFFSGGQNISWNNNIYMNNKYNVCLLLFSIIVLHYLCFPWENYSAGKKERILLTSWFNWAGLEGLLGVPALQPGTVGSLQQLNGAAKPGLDVYHALSAQSAMPVAPQQLNWNDIWRKIGKNILQILLLRLYEFIVLYSVTIC